MNKKEYKKRLEKEKRELREFRESDMNSNIKTGIIISVCVIGFVLLMFAFTKIKTGEWNLFTSRNDITYKAEVQTTKILCGSVLNRTDSEYFVVAYEFDEDSVSLYDTIIERYNSSSKGLSLYKLDLSNSRNNICVGNDLKISNSVSELKLAMPTLLKVKDGKIVESYTNYEKIKDVLLSYVD